MYREKNCGDGYGLLRFLKAILEHTMQKRIEGDKMKENGVLKWEKSEKTLKEMRR